LIKFISPHEETIVVDALAWISKVTLDIIGLAGFNYKFNALNTKPEASDQLSKAFESIFQEGTKFDTWGLLTYVMPVLRLIVCITFFF
jgi:hypothetical protein